MRRHVLPLLVLLAISSSCSTIRTAGHVIDAVKMVSRSASSEDEVTAVSFTLQNGPEIHALAEGISQFDLEADIQAIERGVTVVKLVGAYIEIMSAINWLIIQGATAILANDELSQTLLAVILKSGL